MRIKMEKPKKEIEEFSIKQDPLFSMTEQELEAYIDTQINNIEDIKNLMKKVIKLARYGRR